MNRGPVLMLAGIGLFALLDGSGKLLSGGYGMPQVIGLRYAAVVVLVLAAWPWLARGRGWTAVWPRGLHWRAHLVRGVAAIAASGGFFLAFRSLPLAEGYLLFFLSPFLTLAMNAVWLRERVPAAAWGWCGLAFVGVAIALAPRLAVGGAWSGYAFAALGAFGHAVTLTANRSLRDERAAVPLVLIPALVCVLALAPFMTAGWRAPPAGDLLLMLVNGALLAAATLSVAFAFRHAGAARLVPFEFSALLWSAGLDWAVWGGWPAWTTLLGGAVVVLACWLSERARQAAEQRVEGQGISGGKTCAPALSSGSGVTARAAASGSAP